MPPDPSRRSERSRRAILDAALSLVCELGYDNVSIEAIAKRAGVSKATIYRWWPSKGAVVLEATTESLDPVLAYPNTGNIAADLRAQLDAIRGLITATGTGLAYRGLIAAGQSDATLLQAVFDQVIEPSITTFGARIAKAQQRQEIHPDVDVQTLRDLLYGFLEYRLFHSMTIETRHIDAVMKIVFDGVRKDDRQAPETELENADGSN
jgi:AcrR family transcriptional regulator